TGTEEATAARHEEAGGTRPTFGADAPEPADRHAVIGHGHGHGHVSAPTRIALRRPVLDGVVVRTRASGYHASVTLLHDGNLMEGEAHGLAFGTQRLKLVAQA